MITLLHDLFLTFVFIYTEKRHAKLCMKTMVSNIWNTFFFFFKVKFKKFRAFTNRITTFSQFIQQKCISDPSCYFEGNKYETVFNLHWIFVGHKKLVLFSMVKKLFFLLIIEDFCNIIWGEILFIRSIILLKHFF